MPVLTPGQPTVSIALPVPTPVAQKPRAPVSFRAPAPQLQQVGPSGVPAPQTPPPQMSALILPWSGVDDYKSTGTMGKPVLRRRKMEVVRYSAVDHRSFQKAVNGGDRNAAKVYADYLEERGLADPRTLEHLRTSDRPMWVSPGSDGRVHAGHSYTMQQIRELDRTRGGHWFDRTAMRFFRTRLHGAPVQGPGGVYFVTSDSTGPSHTARGFTVRKFTPESATHRGNVGTAPGEQLARHPDLVSARNRARELAVQVVPPDSTAPDPPEHLSRRKFVVARYSASPTDLAGLLRTARGDPYEPTRHAVIADALDEAYPGNHVSGLIRKQFGFGEHGGEGGRDYLNFEPFYNSWDGSFPYQARLGTYGPFDLYLGHEGEGPNARWHVHAISRLRGSRDSGYTFEFPHEKAHLIPRMFPVTEKYINRGNTPSDNEEVMRLRQQEADRFNDRMDQEERDRP